jgi:hypothetical protein
VTEICSSTAANSAPAAAKAGLDSGDQLWSIDLG